MMTSRRMIQPAAIAAAAMLGTAPAFAASGPFFSLHNTDFVVTIAFLLFLGIIFYMKVPSAVGTLLDKRAVGIRADLDAARRLRDEAHEIYASFVQRERDVHLQAEEIVANARREAEASAAKAQRDLDHSVALRLKAAQEQIASAEADAVHAVRDRAVQAAVAAAADLLQAQQTDEGAAKAIDRSIEEVAQRLH